MARRWMPLFVVGLLALAGGAGLLLVARDDEGGEISVDGYTPVVDPARFTAEVDNPFLPLRPGTTWVYEGWGDEGEVERTVVEVTTRVRTVMGVRCVVVRDTVTADGQLVEDTLDWYAQDDAGNVWYFGEDTAEYEDGRVVSHAGAWEAGVDGAQPGIVMPAQPRVGERYRQEYYRNEAEDMGKVLSVDEHVVVPAGEFTDVLLTKDFSPLEPDVIEHKFYARGVGLIREVKVAGGAGGAELVATTTTATST